jgi:outer membrane protein assembly factor BamE
MRKPTFALNLFGNRYLRCSQQMRAALHYFIQPWKRTPRVLAVAAYLTLASCTTILTNLPGVYSADVQQGNIIDQVMIDQLRPAMNKRQVLYIMGSPMLVDFFHQKRWDYLYSAQIDGGDRQQKRVSLFFDKDQLLGVQGDFKPSTVPVIKPSEEATVDVPKRDLEKTMWEKITGLFFGYDGIDSSPKSNKTDVKPVPGSVADQLPL